jgi:hypothetical protein
VALQGTLETFSLPDVLQLLSSTKKTGCLRVTGDRGQGNIWLKDGAIVGGETSAAPNAEGGVDVVFELLRFAEGEFVFEDGGEPESPGTPVEVTAALDEAGAMLEEWKAIEAVVPSGAHWVSLTAELTGDEVVVTAESWRAVVAVGGGTSVAGLGATLALGELAVARMVKSLVEQSLIGIDEPRAEAPAVSEPAPEPAPEPEPEPEPEPAPEPEAPVDAGAVEPAADEPFEPFDPDALVIDPDSPLVADAPSSIAAVEPEVEPEAEAEAATEPVIPEPGEAAEIARQLANLSPKAARAVAAAAKATTPEEREAALAEVEASDEAINRDLLLKFLGTVN